MKTLSLKTLIEWEQWAKQVMTESPILTPKQEKAALILKYHENTIKMRLDGFKANFAFWIFMILALSIGFYSLIILWESFLLWILYGIVSTGVMLVMWKWLFMISNHFYPRYAVLHLERGILALEEGKKVETQIDLSKNIELYFYCIYDLNPEAFEPQNTDRIHCKCIGESNSKIWIFELGRLCNQNIEKIKEFEQLLTKTIDELGGTYQVEWLRQKAEPESRTGLKYE